MNKTIAHITDIHLDEAYPKEQGVDQKANWEILLTDLKSQAVDSVIFGGDIGEPESLSYFLESLKEYPLSISLGNHDQFEVVAKVLSPHTDSDGLYHYEEDEYYRYIVMDSSKEEISDKQLIWFEEAIKTDKRILLSIHHPILPVPSYVDGKYALKGREKLQSLLLKQGNPTTILCGHYHLEDERSEGNIEQLVTPAASFMMEKSMSLNIINDRFGYRILKISPRSITSNVIYLQNQ